MLKPNGLKKSTTVNSKTYLKVRKTGLVINLTLTVKRLIILYIRKPINV